MYEYACEGCEGETFLLGGWRLSARVEDARLVIFGVEKLAAEQTHVEPKEREGGGG